MTSPNPKPGQDDETDLRPASRLERRRNKIVEEIQANRRGEFTVPTWVLAAILLLLLAGWAAIIIFS
jgi:hypothetical protein